MKVLVIDDKKSIRDSISQLLTPLGYTVNTAVNGLDGFEKAQQTSFSLYIIDHLMPLMNGVTLTKNLKKTEFCSNTPVLFMTTQNKESIKDLPEFSLFDSVLSKPLNEVEFISAVKGLIGSTPSINTLCDYKC